jgi:hypothetical protein
VLRGGGMIVRAQYRRKRLGDAAPIFGGPSAAQNVQELYANGFNSPESPSSASTGYFGLPVTPQSPFGVNLTNLTSGTLSADQVVALQQQAVADNNQVLANLIANGGVDSPGAQALQAQIDQINAATVAGVGAAANTSSDPLLAATGIPWYYWAAGVTGLLIFLEMRK